MADQRRAPAAHCPVGTNKGGRINLKPDRRIIGHVIAKPCCINHRGGSEQQPANLSRWRCRCRRQQSITQCACNFDSAFHIANA